MSSKLNAFLVGLAAVGVLSIGFAAGFVVKQTAGASSARKPIELPEIMTGDSATGGKFMSCATGWIDDDGDVEGLFVLDHMTGTLYCWIIDPRTAALGASVQTNVLADLRVDGKAGDTDYVMVTGYCDFNTQAFPGRANTARTVVYVGEGNSGRVAAYTVRSQGQNVAFQKIGVGQTRDPNAIRE